MRIAVFGIGDDCCRLINNYPDVLEDIVVFVDNFPRCDTVFNKAVIKPEGLTGIEFDYLVIATSKYFMTILRQCYKKLKIEFDKIISVEEYLKIAIVNGTIVPKRIKIDACSLCQLDCPKCYMRQYPHKVVGEGYLRFENFKKLIDDNKEIREIELSNWGEVFLNPELKEILQYAYTKHVDIYMGNGVNFNQVSDEMIETLVQTQVRFINISIDGTSQEIYSMYRRRGNLDTVMKNIRKLNAYKEKYHSDFPRLQWQYIIFNHNEHQVSEAKEMARMLHMDIFFKLQHDEGYIPQNRKLLAEVTGLRQFSIEEYWKENKETYDLSCTQLYDGPQINWDGTLLGCCRVFDKDFGGVNVFEVGLKKALSSKKFVETKKALLGDTSIQLDGENPCGQCVIYKRMRDGKEPYLSYDKL